VKIVVCIKQVADSAAQLTVDGGKISWGDAPLIINPWDEYAVEAALSLVEENGGDVTTISVGGESAKDALKHTLAMGSKQAYLVDATDLQEADSLVVSKVLAAAINKIGDVDLVVFGKQAIDSDTGLTPPQTARVLGYPIYSMLAKIESVDESSKSLKVERVMEEARQVIEGTYPAVLSIVKDFGEPRYPSFMGIRKASKADIPVWSLADIGVEIFTSQVKWVDVVAPASKDVVNELITGDSPEEIANKLADKIMAEKVL
jgi:electron transfer flavoprotein beta subunit